MLYPSLKIKGITYHVVGGFYPDPALHGLRARGQITLLLLDSKGEHQIKTLYRWLHLWKPKKTSYKPSRSIPGSRFKYAVRDNEMLPRPLRDALANKFVHEGSRVGFPDASPSIKAGPELLQRWINGYEVWSWKSPGR